MTVGIWAAACAERRTVGRAMLVRGRRASIFCLESGDTRSKPTASSIAASWFCREFDNGWEMASFPKGVMLGFFFFLDLNLQPVFGLFSTDLFIIRTVQNTISNR